MRMPSTLIVDGFFKCIERCSWRAVPGHHDSSEWFKWHTLMLSCLDMTSHSQLTIANLGAGCPPPLDDGSFKCLQRCSWWAITGRHDGYEWFNWHTLTLSCPNMTSYSQVTIANSGACSLPPKDDVSFKCIQRCSGRAVPGCLAALNGSNNIPWHCLALIWHPNHSWQFPKWAQTVYPWLILQMSSWCSWRAVPGLWKGNSKADFFAYI